MTTSFKGTLLIIDDMPDNVKILLKFLSEAGFRVLAAQNGKQGLKTAEYAHPDLILLDVMMPEIDGFQVCRILKSQENTQDIPIIFMTALADTADKVKGFELGAADYITKPFQQKEVLARVKTQIHLYQLQKKLQIHTIELQNHTQELEKRNMELDAFAHTVAHDLKNPLNAILCFTDLAMDNCSKNELIDEQSLEPIEWIKQAGEQMLSIIEAMLLLAGVSRQVNIQIEPLNMSYIIEQVMGNLSCLVNQYQAEIQIPEHWPMAKGYAPWVEEIWSNYLSNGLKYGGQPPHLELGADLQTDEGLIRFWVRDNGLGLTQKAQAQLFTPFTRLHTHRAPGHGLGLSIVQQMVEKLEGQVGVKSAPEQGSLFYFTLPKA